MWALFLLIGVWGFATCMLLALLGGRNTNDVVQARISRALGHVPSANLVSEDERNLRERVLVPVMRTLAAGIARWTPKSQHQKTAAKLTAAGLAGRWESTEWKGFQYALGVLAALLNLGFFTLIGMAVFWRMEALVVGFLIGYLFPDSWLKARAKRRQKEIQETLPDVLDLLTVSVEAGLGFDAALLKVVEKHKGAVAAEFLRVLQEIKMGRPRRDALRDLGRRNQVEDLSNFVASLVQADQLGISIGSVLRHQAAQMRQKRRQRAEEKAQKAPVKMMVPLVFFVFPGVFIVILGPAVIQVLENFKR